MPVAEIQFRKYADPAAEQLNNCGTMRWRTANRFAAPIVVRMPGGFGKDVGDPWHSLSDEVRFAHAYGWQVAMPSNAADAVGLLRSAMRGANPTIFFEHRSLLMTSDGSSRYPGDDYVVPFGSGATLRTGSDITLVSWGALVHRCVEAADRFGDRVEVIDLRSIAPWDRARVLESVKKTGRCVIAHEDNITAGFGAEIAASWRRRRSGISTRRSIALRSRTSRCRIIRCCSTRCCRASTDWPKRSRRRFAHSATQPREWALV